VYTKRTFTSKYTYVTSCGRAAATICPRP